MPARFTVNKGTLFVNVVNQVNSSQIRKEVVAGESYIVVPSWTLPDDVVMNGGLYPSEEIEASYMSLNGTHAPIEHPKNSDGNYILAVDPESMVNGYLIGAKNKNVRRENGRVYAEKWVPERLASNSDKGKRLLDRLNNLMAGKGEPIHTSTGVLLEREDINPPMTNAAGVEYTWMARNMVFDHDAILLDSPGAATPNDGVGIGVNSATVEGQEVERILALIANEETEQPETNEEKPSKINQLMSAIKAIFAGDDKTAYNNTDTNVNPESQTKEGTRMDKIIAALNAKGIQTNGLSDYQLLAEYNKMLLADNGDAITKAVQSAIEPVANELKEVKAALAANADKDKADMVDALVSADVGLDADDLKGLSVNAMQKLHAKHCQTTASLNGAFNSAEQGNTYKIEMPE